MLISQQYVPHDLGHPVVVFHWQTQNFKHCQKNETSTSVPQQTKTPKDTDSASAEEKQQTESKQYDLTAVVCYINEPAPSERKNVVALIKIPDSYLPHSQEDKWYLFNDFSICPVPAKEAVWFSLDWKVPCVLYYSSPEVRDSKTDILAALNKVSR